MITFSRNFSSPGCETSYFILYLHAFSGMGLCFVNMNSIIITTLYFSQRRIFALGIVVCGTGAGTMVFAAAANVILKTMSWETVCLIEASLVLSMAIASVTFRPLEPTLIQTESALKTVVVKKEEDIDDNKRRRVPRRTIYYIRYSGNSLGAEGVGCCLMIMNDDLSDVQKSCSSLSFPSWTAFSDIFFYPQEWP